ncbi:MAG: hypothetical protein J6S67_11015 [Methanobrevibacter sp.]|nr:hypothetical protein [Methanobrevibacter sp.]
MQSYLIPIDEVAKILQYTGDRAIRRTHDWLLSRGVKQFRRGGLYSRSVIDDVLRRESEKCISENEGKSTTYRAKSVWVKTQLKSKNTARDLLALKMQESMPAN